MKRKKLVIISHTEHYYKNNDLVGWGATVNEINFLSDYWEEIVHIACLYKSNAPPSSIGYSNENIKFVPLRPTGGEHFWEKFNIVWNIPFVLLTVFKAIRGASEVQLRTPTGIGVYLLPAFSFIFKRRFTFWVKYAGNWKQDSPPLGYKFQRWWLKKNLADCKVTINGFWEDQPKHCYSFENPCLTIEQINNGKIIQSNKNFNPPFRLAFVGRLEDAKGVNRIIEALKNVDVNLIERIDFIGDGSKKNDYQQQLNFLNEKVVFHGFLENTVVHKILSEAHFFLLPSDSEGFPKVIAEAACYGCIPIVSDVGSIGHYIKNDVNGFLWEINGKNSFALILEHAFSGVLNELEEKSKNILPIAEKFTFDNYAKMLEKMIFNK